MEGRSDALGEGGIRVGRVLPSFFPGDEPEMLADVFGGLAGLMQAGGAARQALLDREPVIRGGRGRGKLDI